MEPELHSGARRRTLADRAKAILLTPKTEWPLIDAEPDTVGGIFRSYVVPLAAIGPIANLIGSLVFGWRFFGIVYRPPVIAAVGGALVSYVAALIGVFVLAFIIDALAPTFSGTKSQVQSFKVAAYGATASWVAGIFGILPMIGWLAILGLYSLYLFYLGLPLLMRSPREKALGYAVVTIICAAVIALVIGAITAPVVRLFGGGAAAGLTSAPGDVSGTVAIPGGGTLDLGKLNAATAQAEAASASIQNGTTKAVDPAQLQALLPANFAGFNRTELSSSGAAAAGIGGAEADGTYQNGGQSFTLKITDLAAAGAFASLGSAFNVQTSKQTATGYEKAGTVDGRMTTEKWDNASKSGSYGVLVGSRFNIEAEGSAPSIDVLKAAITAVDPARLEALAKS